MDAKGGVAETSADDGDEGGGDSDAPESEHKDLPARCFGWIMAIVVGSDRAPAGGARKADSHKREPGACESEPGVKSGNRGVDMWCCLANQDAEKDDGHDPGIFLIRVDQRKAEDRDEVADHSDDDTAHRDGHLVVGHGRQDLTTDNDVDDGKAGAKDNVQDRAELCAVEAEGVSRRCDGTKTKLEECMSVRKDREWGRHL